jgi:hypothetical protein
LGAIYFDGELVVGPKCTRAIANMAINTFKPKGAEKDIILR